MHNMLNLGQKFHAEYPHNVYFFQPKEMNIIPNSLFDKLQYSCSVLDGSLTLHTQQQRRQTTVSTPNKQH